MLDGFVPFLTDRTPEDILLGRIRFSLGGQAFDLPVRTIAANRRWLAALNQETGEIVAGLDAAGEDTEAIFSLLAAKSENLPDLLLSYDETGVLPAKADLEELARPHELMIAVMGVWRAANPLVDIAIEGLKAQMREVNATLAALTPPSEPTSSPPKPTAGRRRRFKPN